MKEIISSDIGQGPIDGGNQSGLLNIYDGLETPISEDVITLSTKHKTQIEEYAKKAASEYGDRQGQKEPTYVQELVGIPSLIVRIDCTIDENGDIVAYELEDSPSGQGITDKVHSHIKGEGIKERLIDHYTDAIGDIPHVLVSGHRSHGTDDNIIVGQEKYLFNEIPASVDGPVIVKAIPGIKESHAAYLHLQSQAVAPLATEGDKSYAVSMGDLKEVESETDLLLCADGELASQVAKSRLGSMAMGVSMYLNPLERKKYGKRGTVTASKLSAKIVEYQDRGGALLQRFVAPIQLENNEGRSNAIMRVFVLLDSRDGEVTAEAIGGCYVARPELIVHGASNAVAGAVLVE